MSDIIPCIGGITFTFMVMLVIVSFRYMTYLETIKLAEKGLLKPQRDGAGKGTLVWGIIVTALGVALLIGLWPLGFMFTTKVPLGFGPWMLAGLVPTFIGLALLLVYVLTRPAKTKE